MSELDLVKLKIVLQNLYRRLNRMYKVEKIDKKKKKKKRNVFFQSSIGQLQEIGVYQVRQSLQANAKLNVKLDLKNFARKVLTNNIS